MNGLADNLDVAISVARNHCSDDPRVVICPPATLIGRLADLLKRTRVAVGAQDCHPLESGAHTGDVSAEMLADAGAEFVILGHSERRTNHRETDMQVRAKAQAVWRASLTPIICVGETEDQRDSGQAAATVERQLKHSIPEMPDLCQLVIAYEPVWAIGTGRTPETAEIKHMHSCIRSALASLIGAKRASRVSLLYGGSVNPNNATKIFSVPNVDGGLIGGASLEAQDFILTIKAATT